MTTTADEVTPLPCLPTSRDAGRHAVWTLPLDDADPLIVDATFLGIGSSRRSNHRPHPGNFAARGERCAACRWFEPRIFVGRVAGTDDEDRYLLYFVGGTIVPGETTRHRAEWATSPLEVIEALTTRRTNRATQAKEAYLTVPAARVLAQAADYDEELREAYVDRAVV